MNTNTPVPSVALIIYNAAGEVFTIQELVAKPQFLKIPGRMDYSFPWETQELGESDADTLKRVRYEEVDASGLIQISEPELLCSRLLVINDQVTVTVYASQYLGGPIDVRGSAAGKEIIPLGFLAPQSLLSRCRGGVQDIMRVFEIFKTSQPLLVSQA